MAPLSDSDKTQLLRLARQAVEECALGRSLPQVEEPQEESLGAKCGAFVTLRKAGRLRGCIGHIEASASLRETVRECAVAAAVRDPRFKPVTPVELADLHIEISVLSTLTDVRPEEVEVGRHGLLISRSFHRGLLLPQVATQWHWDREQFLEQTCLKAGLPPDAWRHEARIQAFTAEVFAEAEDKKSRQSTVDSPQQTEGQAPRC
ncbi:MAG TPA: AmmeMemoRadiSam system protein A [Terriglobia bacterium]|jgi:AmmeMemoRadiSam system protein A|nr:AmmeMemoRadiSam system protein A [Terriglobia bacterium]